MLRFLYGLQKYKTKKITINGKAYSAILANTSIKRTIGLMFREKLPARHCMLFIFDYQARHSIWMRNMRFPIDAVWVDEDGTVVGTKEGLKPCNSFLNCPQYAPEERASYLIELNSGVARRERIRKGSRIAV